MVWCCSVGAGDAVLLWRGWLLIVCVFFYGVFVVCFGFLLLVLNALFKLNKLFIDQVVVIF